FRSTRPTRVLYVVDISDGSEVGADAPPLTQAFTIQIVGDPGTDSGLDITERDSIFLSQEAPNLIFGRVQGGTFNDQAAFAIYIEDDGDISVAQYLSIRHDDRGDKDESNDNGSEGNDVKPGGLLDDEPDPVQQSLAGKIEAVLTIKDSDGDTDVDTAQIGDRIIFQDDGPSLNIVDTPNEVNENASINGTCTLSEVADGVANGVDISVNGGVAQNLSVPNGVLVVGPPTDSEAFSVLGGRCTVFNTGTWTYQAGSVASEQSFSFKITATDGDGDPASDTQTITVHDVAQPVLQNGFTNTVEEEHLQPDAAGTYSITASGNEDTQDASGLDTDENAPDFFNTIPNVKSGVL